MPPQEEAAQAEQTRDQLEQALVGLFVIGVLAQEEEEGEPPDIDVQILRRLVSNTVGWFRRSLSRSGLDSTELTSDQDLLAKLMPKILDHFKAIRKWAKEQPQAEAGELSVQRRAARGLATAVFNAVGEEVGRAQAVEVRKVWVTRADARVRPLHRRLHGRSKALGDVFYRWPTGQQLRFPGDPEAPLDATIGCRCVLIMSTSTAEEIKAAFPPLPDES